MSKPSNPPLFLLRPFPEITDDDADILGITTDITLRDLAAIAAMQGMLTEGSPEFDDIPELAYDMADALLAARENTQGEP